MNIAAVAMERKKGGFFWVLFIDLIKFNDKFIIMATVQKNYKTVSNRNMGICLFIRPYPDKMCSIFNNIFHIYNLLISSCRYIYIEKFVDEKS